MGLHVCMQNNLPEALGKSQQQLPALDCLSAALGLSQPEMSIIES